MIIKIIDVNIIRTIRTSYEFIRGGIVGRYGKNCFIGRITIKFTCHNKINFPKLYIIYRIEKTNLLIFSIIVYDI